MLAISVVVPTYRRERVLVETLEALSRQLRPDDELLVIDQTERHEPATDDRLRQLHETRVIRWIRQAPPSITAAMNRGLLEATREVVLFCDDDIVPGEELVTAHRGAHAAHPGIVVAGRVTQPWQRDGRRTAPGGFASGEPRWIEEFMGGNFSVRRMDALQLGGFDENFVQVAYRFEAEFAHRVLSSGRRIRFEPAASLQHLHTSRGGTRSYGEHLRTAQPAHAVGAYYCALRIGSYRGWLRECVTRPLRAIATRYHLRAPWWIPMTLVAEVRALVWAVRLHRSGPRLIRSSHPVVELEQV